MRAKKMLNNNQNEVWNQRQKIVSFRGVKIHQYQADVLQELEQLTGKQFSNVNELATYTRITCFTVANYNVVGLGLYDHGLSILPESIGNLSSLKELALGHNKLASLPESIGNLSSLQILRLAGNKLTNLPESILNLESLVSLNLSDNQLKELPKLIGNLKALRNLYLINNELLTLPESIRNLKSLKTLELGDNKLLKEVPDTFKAMALRASSHDKKLLMKIVKASKKGVIKSSLKYKIKNISSKIKQNSKPLIYAGIIGLVGLLSFLVLNTQNFIQNINPYVFWVFFIGALIINLLIGASIISTLSGYLKKSVDKLGNWIRKHTFGLFDVFVIFYLVWSIRAAIKTGLTIELIPAIDFAFEYIIPQWFLNILGIFGYNIDLSFLENLDLFLGHFYLKLFGIALVFWALYRNGISYVKKTAFEREESKNIWAFLIFGLYGAFLLALLDYSNLKPFLSITYSVGASIGCCLFIWETNRDNSHVFFLYISLIGSGILVVWLLSLWNLVISLVIGAIFVIMFFYVRWRVETRKGYLKYEIDPEQAKILNDLQRIIKKPIPRVNIFFEEFGVKIDRSNIVGLRLYKCGLESLPESIGTLPFLKELILHSNQLSSLPESITNLKLLQTLDLEKNQLTALPESIGNLESLTFLTLNVNKLKTLPESICNLSSLQRLYLEKNQLTTLPKSIGNLKSLKTLLLEKNQLTILPESIGNLSSLEFLDLNENWLMTLPESITNLKSLKTLWLEKNQLTTLPGSIGNLESLKGLNLDDNQLLTLPESISNLKSLEGINLDNNQLLNLPESISNLDLLQKLSLDNNQLSNLPESIIKLNSLKNLWLKGNPLTKRTNEILRQLKKKGISISK